MAAATALATCSAPKPDAGVAAPTSWAAGTEAAPRSSGSAPAAGASTSAEGAPSGSVVSSASLPPRETPEAPPERTTTPGKIQCQTVDCDLPTEVCCVEDGFPRCVPRPSAPDARPCGADLQIEQRECDEAADCGAGESCCRAGLLGTGCSPGVIGWRCSRACGSSGKLSDALCLSGSTCKSGPCVASEDLVGWPQEGFCPLDTPALGCGQETCKPGEACCWDAMAKTGSCTADGSCGPATLYEEGKSFAFFACERPSDCGPGLECFSSTGMFFYQEFRCAESHCSFTPLIDGPFLCGKLADCPVLIRDSEGGEHVEHRPTSCGSRLDYPPGVKVCRYR